MIKQITVPAALLLLLATQTANVLGSEAEAHHAVNPSTYTLTDFDMDSVEPGFTLLSESNPATINAFPSKTHINAPHSFHKHFALGWEKVAFETTVGVFYYVEPAAGNYCSPTMDMTGYIVGAKAAIGCSNDVIARAHKEGGAKGVFLMSYLPYAGQPSLFWSWKNGDDLLGFPALELNGYTRSYLIEEFYAGNETVVAMASGDVNIHHEELGKAGSIMLYLVTNILVFGSIGLCVYVRKLIYDQAPANKKWERSIATTCIELEIFVAVGKIFYAITFGHGYHIYPFNTSVVMVGGFFSTDLMLITSAFMIVYWLSLTSSKKMSKGQTFLSKAAIIGIVVFQLPFLVMSFVGSLGYIYGNIFIPYYFLMSLGFQPFDYNTPMNIFRLSQVAIFGVVYTIVGAKFLLFLRKSSVGSSNNDAKTKMMKRMATGLLVSALAQGTQAYSLYYYTFTEGAFLNYTPMGGQKVAMICQMFLACLVSLTQIFVFAGPALRNKRESNFAKSKASTADQSSSAGSSSSASSSSSAGVSSSADSSSNAASSSH